MAMCAGKVRFRGELDAKLCLLHTQRKGDDAQRQSTPRRAYRCPRCRGWHLTSMSYGERSAARR